MNFAIGYILYMYNYSDTQSKIEQFFVSKEKNFQHGPVAIFHVMPQTFLSNVCNYISESSPAVEDEPPLSQESLFNVDVLSL